MRKRKTAFDVEKWAETTSHTRRGPLCRICGHRDASEAVRIVVERRNAGKSDVSINQTCAMILEQFGLKVCRTSLSAHVTEHLGSKW